TVALCRQPSAAMAVGEVPSPSAAIAIRSPQVDASTRGALIVAKADMAAGKAAAALLSRQNPTKANAKTGTGIFAAALATLRRANSQPMQSTVGSIRKTRNNLTITAVLPAVSDAAYPAPTTCATSWMVAPNITPVVCWSNPSAMHARG